MIDKLEIQSGLAKRILNTLPYLHTPEAIAQGLDKTEVMRNILQTSELTDTITKIKVKLMQVKDIRGTANRVTESQILDDIELFELKAFSLLVVEMRELLLSANITVVSLPDLEPVAGCIFLRLMNEGRTAEEAMSVLRTCFPCLSTGGLPVSQ